MRGFLLQAFRGIRGDAGVIRRSLAGSLPLQLGARLLDGAFGRLAGTAVLLDALQEVGGGPAFGTLALPLQLGPLSFAGARPPHGRGSPPRGAS